MLSEENTDDKEEEYNLKEEKENDEKDDSQDQNNPNNNEDEKNEQSSQSSEDENITQGMDSEDDVNEFRLDDQLANEHTDNKGDVEHGQHDEPAKAGILSLIHI